MRSIGVLLFPGFELLDVFGPLEMFGLLPEELSINLVAEQGGSVASHQGPKSVVDYTLSDSPQYDIILVPGGLGTRKEVNNPAICEWLCRQSQQAEYVASVCTGSALLASAGLLDDRKATTNKLVFEWVVSQGPRVMWQKKARWVEDGKFFTSSGVSAGIDMALALIRSLFGQDKAEQIATFAEYDWHRDADWDPFAACLE